jgi:hypothetical protein
MKEDVKMKENMNVEPAGTMPQVGAMPHMQANPNISPVQTNPMGVSPAMMNQMPIQTNPMGVMPSMMNQMPVQPNPMGVMPSMMNPMPMMPMMCCPYLMNMQCPMTNGQNVMGMNMGNPMLTGMSPAMGAANPGMNSMPAMNQYYPMSGMY